MLMKRYSRLSAVGLKCPDMRRPMWRFAARFWLPCLLSVVGCGGLRQHADPLPEDQADAATQPSDGRADVSATVKDTGRRGDEAEVTDHQPTDAEPPRSEPDAPLMEDHPPADAH